MYIFEEKWNTINVNLKYNSKKYNQRSLYEFKYKYMYEIYKNKIYIFICNNKKHNKINIYIINKI